MASIKTNVKQLIGKSLDLYNKTHMKAAHDRIDNIVAQAGTDNTELVDARIDTAGVKHTTLNNRIKAETKIMGERIQEVSGEYITVENTVSGPITDIEILGSTTQDPNNLVDIKSVGDLQEDGTYKMSILSANKNLFDINNVVLGYFNQSSPSPYAKAFYGWVKVKPNTSYLIYFKSNSTSFRPMVVEFEKDKTKVAKNHYTGDTYQTDKSYSITTQSNTAYICLSQLDVDNVNIDKWEIQLEEGTVATPYTPHVSNKSSILLPCQLGSGDRLYYDDVEGAWCIDKVETKILFKDLIWGLGEDKGLTFKVGSNLPFVSAYDYIISDKYKKGSVAEESNQTQIILFKHSGRSEVRVALAKSEYQSISSLNDAIAYMGKSEGYILVKSPVPQKIILPLNVQIQLNSFLDTTHIYTADTEIEPTIRAKVPKSLGASVESLHHKTNILTERVADIEGLKSSQDMKYSTDAGYLVCNETQDGVVKDVKVKGRTLVNPVRSSAQLVNVTLTSWYNNIMLAECSRLNVNTNYVLIYTLDITNDTSNGKYCIMNLGLGDSTAFNENMPGVGHGKISNGLNVFKFKFTNPNNKTHVHLRPLRRDDEPVNGQLVTYSATNIMLLEEKDYIEGQSYFEGIMSMGEDVDKIEVLSRKEDGNLFDGVVVNGLYDNQNGTLIDSSTAKSTALLRVGSAKRLTKNPTNRYSWYFYTNSKSFIKTIQGSSVNVPEEAVYFTLYYHTATTTETGDIVNIMITKESQIEPYQPYQGDKKAILYQDKTTQEWLPVPSLHEFDVVDSLVGKWYKRSEKVVLNGSEGWVKQTSNTLTNTDLYEFRGAIPGNSLNYKIISTLPYFRSNYATTDIVGLYSYSANNYVDTLCIRIPIGQNIQNYLQANNVPVVYQLAQEEVYDISPISVDAYSNKTMISLNSGVIIGNMEFSITTYINNLVKQNRQDIKRLQDDFYSYTVTQNRILLASAYSADSVTFKVDFDGVRTMSEECNDDKYNLILNNILVGKDNYDYDKMFIIIMDYVVWMQLTWDQFDELVGIMGEQYNPPVEEVPEEI